ncbi:hypothetical protein L228DRAFT_264880 [Xylona heveae TC161]|uniref:Uncharacterized protein n=1 Tax=Xylona heveae (strain CBS 132557 / TC161) TaxID=1328760 RepID=A0A165JPR0_XYLHT|nr:hypothetical protein L228DRAFT_264880 [Xylona heveae TC161]KZF26492.1 hypothetical protein L228DRAFT_264880 [Xylona heveae TC161]
MAGSGLFNSLSIAKRDRRSRYTSVPSEESRSTNHSADLEKHAYSSRPSLETSDYDSSSTYSSRTPSDSLRPMLRASALRRKASSYHFRIPRVTTRFLCLALASTILLFMFTLVRMSWTSAKLVEKGIGIKPPPKPAVWEDFPFLTRYYGGIRTLVPRKENVPEYPYASDEEPQSSAPESQSADNPGSATRRDSVFPLSSAFNPYPDYTSDAYLAEFPSVSQCFLDADSKVRVPKIHSYSGVTKGFPDPAMGSYDVLGLRDDICFDRFGRLGPYGFGYSKRKGGTGAGLYGDREGAENVWEEDGEVDYRKVSWADVQKRCLSANAHRFNKPKEDDSSQNGLRERDEVPPDFAIANSTGTPRSSDEKKRLPRTAVVIRTWWDYQYKPEDILMLRALISELSLLSGGEYTVHFLIHVKDNNVQIWADEDVYQQVLRDSLPEEFRGMGTLWTERQIGLIYGGLHDSMYRNLPVHGVYRSSMMPMQWFSHQHPEYDYIWNWEMDVRYTGQYYHLFDSVTRWAREQPRKGLWERSGRFYVPSVHGSWDDFKHMVRVQTEMGTDNPNNIWSGKNTGKPRYPGDTQGKTDKPVWGPERPEDDDIATEEDIIPPMSYEKDKYEWGVGEDADLITFNPLFDPEGTTWLLAEDVTGYNTTRKLPPRRTAIITASRLSRRLLKTMHHETSLKRHTMFSEMWAASVALQHGFKAVYAPHPVYIDRKWPPSYLAGVFNGGRNGATGGARTSVFGEREHNFRGTTWYYNAGHSPNLWKRWLGLRVDNNGGDEAEKAQEGRMCLPGVLLHPVKGVDLVIEGRADEI